ncbi:MAG: hypothetical protein CM1200mP39_17610 [Dehalococcoidia bacterium]|nr:MAG: hypothetical protein CM1200mP39_17610 [Dehalococcoidia bacterium]
MFTGLKTVYDCGMGIRRANSRRYTADIPQFPGVDVLFQRQSDITTQVDSGSADIGSLAWTGFMNRVWNAEKAFLFTEI